MSSTRGHCLCGQVKFSFDPAGVNWRGHCHCESCRRATSSPMTSFLGIRNSAWRWMGAAPQTYRSSPGVTRYFCGTCGTPMAYASTRWSEETHFYAASLDDPSDFQPEFHTFWGEKLPWIDLKDNLPRHIAGSADDND